MKNRLLPGMNVMLSLGLLTLGFAAEAAVKRGSVNVRDFSDHAASNDWSGAIQAAIDYVNASNGFERGATVLFPPGIYPVGQTIVLGKRREHHGVRLSGYGAVLLGAATLDAQPLDYDARVKAAEESGHKFNRMSLPGELDFDGEHVGAAILELWSPRRKGDEMPVALRRSVYEGSSFVLEGLTFHRESPLTGVGVKIPAEQVPKNVTFRDVVFHNQNVGVHINHCYQIRFEDCIFRGNRIGLWGRNHWNGVSILNSSFRRHVLHGLVIGPNAGSWGSSVTYIAGCVFEDIRGYAIYNAGGNQVAIINNYFEANGNDVGVFTPYGHTLLELNHFWGFHKQHKNLNKVRDTVVSGVAHIVAGSQSVVARGNNYRHGIPILLFGLRGANTFDATPVVAEGVELPDGATAGRSDGLGAYVYDAAGGSFTSRDFAFSAAPQGTAEAAPPAAGGDARSVCDVCGHVYDPAVGDPAHGVPPGTSFDDVPAEWCCPSCGAVKSKFLGK